MGAIVTRWPRDHQPTEADIRTLLDRESLNPYRWQNGPGDTYAEHEHPYHKVIYVVSGSITFTLPQTREQIAMTRGDRLELPAGVRHGAGVGPGGVVCLEAQRTTER